MAISEKDYVTIHQTIHSNNPNVTIKGKKYKVQVHNNGCKTIKIPGVGTFIEQNPDQDTSYSKRAKSGDKITWLIKDNTWGLIVNDEVINK